MSLVLADTSVWIDFFKSGRSEEVEKLTSLLEEDRVCIVPIIKAEILSGARTESEFDALKEKLSALPSLKEPDNIWEDAAWARFRLARKGIQTALIDLSIAITASHNHCGLLTRDNEFRQISSVVRLHLV